MKQKKLNAILTASVSTFMAKQDEGRDTETWKVSLIGHKKDAYLKITTDTLLTLTEIAASQVGIGLGLNIPPAYLVTVIPNDLRKIESKYQSSVNLLCFASESCGEDAVSFERLRRKDSIETNGWKELDSTIIFDQWIANIDRNYGNLMYDPQSKSYWLIDHGRALTGAPPAFFDISDPSIDSKNILLSETLNTYPPKDDRYKQDLHIKANSLMLKCKTLDLSSMDLENNYTKLGTAVTREQVIDFLSNRIDETTQLICKKIGMPMLSTI